MVQRKVLFLRVINRLTQCTERYSGHSLEKNQFNCVQIMNNILLFRWKKVLVNSCYTIK